MFLEGQLPESGRLKSYPTLFLFCWVCFSYFIGKIGEVYTSEMNTYLDSIGSVLVKGNTESEVIERIDKFNRWFKDNSF